MAYLLLCGSFACVKAISNMAPKRELVRTTAPPMHGADSSDTPTAFVWHGASFPFSLLSCALPDERFQIAPAVSHHPFTELDPLQFLCLFHSLHRLD
jgi:hypothetical protein